MANEGNLFFGMPPIIGDPSLPYKRAIHVISVNFGKGFENFKPKEVLKKLSQVVLRLPIPDSLLFHAAFESEQKFGVANLIVRAGRDPERPFSDIVILEMRDIQVILFEEYRGDILVGLEFRKVSLIRGNFFMLIGALKVYKAIRDTVRSLPDF